MIFSPLQRVGGGIIGIMLLLTLAGPLLATLIPNSELGLPFEPVSAQHWLGTDYLGEDVLNRLLKGGAMLVLLASLVVAGSWLIAGSLAIFATLRGGVWDRIMRQLADMLQSLPGMLLLMLVVVIQGPGYGSAAIAALLISGMDILRLARSVTLQVMQHDYIEIARLRGESLAWIVRYEAFPALIPLISADIGVRFVNALFVVATASFLGLGAQAPQADWGLMIMENRQGLILQPLAVISPVIALLLLLLPVNLLLDSLFTPVPSRQKTKNQQMVMDINPVDRVLLLVKDFSLSIGTIQLLHAVNLTVKIGEIVTLSGASGSGKTTLLHSLLNDLPLGCNQSGQVWIAGQPVLGCSPRDSRKLRRRYIGYMAQDPRVALPAHQRIGCTLTHRARSLGFPRAEISRYLPGQLVRVGLPGHSAFLQRYPHQLSGGQQQRVLLALALFGDPQLLLLDEPTSALDAENITLFYRLIKRLAREKEIAVLMIAHGMDVIRETADRVVVMAHGECQESTDCQDFFRQPRSEAGKRLLAASLPCQPPRLNVTDIQSGLQVRGLQLQLPSGQILHRDINFSLSVGSCLSIVGASGSGKTTLLRGILGLQPATKGSIYWQQQSLSLRFKDRSRGQRQLMQYVPQNPYDSLNPFWLVRHLLLRPLTIFQPHLRGSELEKELLETMNRVALPTELLSMRVRQLSGGQRQRVALARALAARPQLLICDEVTSALDSENRQSLLRLLNTLRECDEMTLIMVTHDSAMPAEMGGNILHLGNESARVMPAGFQRSMMASGSQNE
ncbi:ATP-binding cassette domain-containing protein [Salmonella enterica subsp. enterica serovar Infantis]|uniref:ATP-binding cassette domain-containing protein n=2 Tax=Salmonella enterica TaxID=28901 RepID=A0A750IP41_SALER|nr:ATP-binding cassette domain-containing protein [Salmonella enterica subsp. enterica serovar Oranienburg]EHA8878915.1 ATP-binding cassette domain-containing protein [Salmonella enterica subsp. enterica serovar Infantis]HAF6298293.1 ATP-binding cassette domain-containing protein [Salmonella enterica]HCA3587605.1 ATP-binding cassette domain-containing protein [Salmonella enterica subsp. enterica serovar Java]EDV9209314.1 ATP-binding cassette domain-containing protein [Salmonella enterica subsp.